MQLKSTEYWKTVAAKEKFDKFDIHYIENPFKEVLDAWVASGHEIYELIEPVDSLHPTQAAQALIAEHFWNQVEERIPHVLGPVNPNNHIIRQLFGDQGGHWGFFDNLTELLFKIVSLIEYPLFMFYVYSVYMFKYTVYMFYYYLRYAFDF